MLNAVNASAGSSAAAAVSQQRQNLLALVATSVNSSLGAAPPDAATVSATATLLQSLTAAPTQLTAASQTAAVDALASLLQPAAPGASAPAPVSMSSAAAIAATASNVALAAALTGLGAGASSIGSGSAPPAPPGGSPAASPAVAAAADAAAQAVLVQVFSLVNSLADGQASALGPPDSSSGNASASPPPPVVISTPAFQLQVVQDNPGSPPSVTTGPITAPGSGSSFDPLPAAALAGATGAVRTKFLSLAFDPYSSPSAAAAAGRGGITRLALTSANINGTFAPLPVASLTQLLTFSLPAPTTMGAGGGGAAPARLQAACTYWDEAVAAYSSAGCVAQPSPLPGGLSVQWADNFTAGADSAGSASLALAWNFTQRSWAGAALLAGCSEAILDCSNATDAARRIFPNPWAPLEPPGAISCGGVSQRMLRVFVGPRCGLWDQNNTAACFWNATAQAFSGTGCVASNQTQCGCVHLTGTKAPAWLGAALLPFPPAAPSAAPEAARLPHAADFAGEAQPTISICSASDLLSLSPSDIVTKLRTFLYVLGALFVGTHVASLAGWRRDKWDHRRMLRSMMSPACGFVPSGETGAWTWILEMDELEGDVGTVRGTLVEAAARIGLPPARIRMSVPTTLLDGDLRSVTGRKKLGASAHRANRVKVAEAMSLVWSTKTKKHALPTAAEIAASSSSAAARGWRSLLKTEPPPESRAASRAAEDPPSPLVYGQLQLGDVLPPAAPPQDADPAEAAPGPTPTGTMGGTSRVAETTFTRIARDMKVTPLPQALSAAELEDSAPASAASSPAAAFPAFKPPQWRAAPASSDEDDSAEASPAAGRFTELQSVPSPGPLVDGSPWASGGVQRMGQWPLPTAAGSQGSPSLHSGARSPAQAESLEDEATSSEVSVSPRQRGGEDGPHSVVIGWGERPGQDRRAAATPVSRTAWMPADQQVLPADEEGAEEGSLDTSEADEDGDGSAFSISNLGSDDVQTSHLPAAAGGALEEPTERHRNSQQAEHPAAVPVLEAWERAGGSGGGGNGGLSEDEEGEDIATAEAQALAALRAGEPAGALMRRWARRHACTAGFGWDETTRRLAGSSLLPQAVTEGWTDMPITPEGMSSWRQRSRVARKSSGGDDGGNEPAKPSSPLARLSPLWSSPGRVRPPSPLSALVQSGRTDSAQVLAKSRRAFTAHSSQSGRLSAPGGLLFSGGADDSDDMVHAMAGTALMCGAAPLSPPLDGHDDNVFLRVVVRLTPRQTGPPAAARAGSRRWRCAAACRRCGCMRSWPRRWPSSRAWRTVWGTTSGRCTRSSQRFFSRQTCRRTGDGSSAPTCGASF